MPNDRGLTRRAFVAGTGAGLVTAIVGVKVLRSDPPRTPGGSTLTRFSVAGDHAELLTPSNPTGHVVVYHHGSNEDQGSYRTADDKGSLITALLGAGFSICSTNAFGVDWGTQRSIDSYSRLVDVVTARLDGGVVHLSQSAGGISGLIGIAQRAFRADGWAGIFPACNLAALERGRLGSFIDDDFQVDVEHPFQERARRFDPLGRPGSAFSLPMRFYASPDDTVVSKELNSDLMAAHVVDDAPEQTVVECSGDHGDSSHFQPTDLVGFFDRCCLRVDQQKRQTSQAPSLGRA